jgi:hypothetical protein
MIKEIIFLTIMSIVHAKWEVQIEGKDGWAAKLPCWRLNVFFRKLLGGKDLTGYHMWMLILFQVMFHGIYMFQNWSWKSEAITQGLFMWYFIVEDVAWFIVNPHYTVKKFKKKDIEWHKRWWGPLPLSYWVMGTIGGLLIWFGYLL